MEKLEFYKQRDVSERINFVFEFIKQNIKPLAKGSIYVAVIFLLTSILAVTKQGLSPLDVVGSPLIWSMSLIQNITTILYTLYIYCYIAEYIRGGESMLKEGIWNKAFNKFGSYFVTSLLIGFLVVIVLFIILMIALAQGVYSAISFDMNSIVKLISSVGLFFVIALIPTCWFLLAVSLYGPIIVAENISGVDSIQQSMRLVKGNWWRTLGFFLLCGLIALAIVLVLSIPTYVSSIFGHLGLGIIFSSIFSVLATLGSMIATVILSVASYVLYTDYKEGKDEISLKEDIESIGQ